MTKRQSEGANLKTPYVLIERVKNLESDVHRQWQWQNMHLLKKK
jgi:hypothetical protein